MHIYYFTILCAVLWVILNVIFYTIKWQWNEHNMVARAVDRMDQAVFVLFAVATTISAADFSLWYIFGGDIGVDFLLQLDWITASLVAFLNLITPDIWVLITIAAVLCAVVAIFDVLSNRSGLTEEFFSAYKALKIAAPASALVASLVFMAGNHAPYGSFGHYVAEAKEAVAAAEANQETLVTRDEMTFEAPVSANADEL